MAYDRAPMRRVLCVCTLLAVFRCATPSVPEPVAEPVAPLPAPTSGSAENVIRTVHVTASALNVRSEPSTEASIVTQVKKGQTLDVLRQDESWVNVRLAGGETGWVASRFVTSGDTKQKTARKKGGCLPDSDYAFVETPALAFSDSGAHGMVVVEAAVNAKGLVTATKLVSNGTGDETLAFLAEREIKGAKFSPPTLSSSCSLPSRTSERIRTDVNGFVAEAIGKRCLVERGTSSSTFARPYAFSAIVPSRLIATTTPGRWRWAICSRTYASTSGGSSAAARERASVKKRRTAAKERIRMVVRRTAGRVGHSGGSSTVAAAAGAGALVAGSHARSGSGPDPGVSPVEGRRVHRSERPAAGTAAVAALVAGHPFTRPVAVRAFGVVLSAGVLIAFRSLFLHAEPPVRLNAHSQSVSAAPKLL